ncbi:MAG: Ig-like domain-containing protein [Candidatus Methanoperedens sp.]
MKRIKQMNIKLKIGMLILIAALVALPGASATPSFAAATGASCGTCHVNPAGGGTLTAVGQIFKQTGSLPTTAAPVLTTITVSPARASNLVGETQTFTAAGLDQNGGSISINPATFWTSSNTTVGTIDSATGVFTALEPGITTIIATNGTDGTVFGMASATVITQGDLGLTTITVSPSTASVAVNGTQTFTATALDQLGNIISAIFSWVSSNPTVGTIDSTGKFTALSAGTTTITASNGSTSGSALVSVGTLPVGHNGTHEQEENEQQDEQEHTSTHEHNNTQEDASRQVHTGSHGHTNTQVRKGATDKNEKD